MKLAIREAEIFGVTESSLTVSFAVEGDSGPVDASAAIRLNGERRALSEGPAGTRLVRVDGLKPGTRYRVEIDVDGAAPPEPHRYFPETVETLPAAEGKVVGSFATMNDLHFGEPRFGGTPEADGGFGEAKPGYPEVRDGDTEEPYWRFMNDDAIAEINSLGVDMTIIKGDIADMGRPEQFGAAAESFARFEKPHHAFLGNHDYYGLLDGLEVDGYALLGQPPAPRAVDLGGWRLVLADSVRPGEHHGVFPQERQRWLDETLAETRESATPTLLFMHHQPVAAEHRHKYPNTIGLAPDDSDRLCAIVGRNPQVKGVLIGHTHRNRIRHYPASGAVPFVEVNCTKDYPGGFGHYRLYDDGTFRQEVRRTSSARALQHSTVCGRFFKGYYREFALGALETRSFATR